MESSCSPLSRTCWMIVEIRPWKGAPSSTTSSTSSPSALANPRRHQDAPHQQKPQVNQVRCTNGYRPRHHRGDQEFVAEVYGTLLSPVQLLDSVLDESWAIFGVLDQTMASANRLHVMGPQTWRAFTAWILRPSPWLHVYFAHGPHCDSVGEHLTITTLTQLFHRFGASAWPQPRQKGNQHGKSAMLVA